MQLSLLRGNTVVWKLITVYLLPQQYYGNLNAYLRDEHLELSQIGANYIF